MGYTGNTWVNNSTPAISAENLNKMEKGIRDAHTGVEEAKLLANTNTIIIHTTLEFKTTEKQYKLPIDNFSFTDYQIFGWHSFASSTVLENVSYTDDSATTYSNKGWFEAHRAGDFIKFNRYSNSGINTASITNDGIIKTIGTESSYPYATVTMFVVPVSKKTITVLS